MKHVPATFGVFLLAAAVSASVHAQQAAEVAEPTPAADSQDATNLDAVIVTGSRSPKAIDKIPGAILDQVSDEARVAHHPKARRKKPTWRK